MALQSTLWETLPNDLLHLVFGHLPLNAIGHLRVLSKEWKNNIDCKDSEFNRLFNLTTQREMFALVSWDEEGNNLVSLNNMQTNKWDTFGKLEHYSAIIKTSIADGGLICNLWQRLTHKKVWQLLVINPLTQRMMRLPPLLKMGSGEFCVEVKIAQLTMDKKTNEYKLHVLCYMETNDNSFFAQAYDFQKKEWSMVESRERRIIGWDQTNSLSALHSLGPCVYDYVDRKLQYFTYSQIAPEVDEDCIELINDHLFVLHQEAPPSSTNLMQDGEDISKIKYCISEFHLSKTAVEWVKLGVHKYDPSIYSSPDKDCDFLLLACDGLLVVYAWDYSQKYDRLWLYNLSTCVWRNLPNLEMDLNHYSKPMLYKISWTALP